MKSAMHYDSSMRTLLASVVSGLLLLSVAAPVEAADVSGSWALEFQRDASGPLYVADCVWEQEGNRLAGSCTSGFESIVTVRGSVQETSVTFQFRTGTESGTAMSFSGRLNEQASSMSGTWRFVDDDGTTGGGTFTATKR
jgi:hypothetical protein